MSPDVLVHIFPDNISLLYSLLLVVTSAVASFVTAAAGIGGGTIMLVAIASLVPEKAIIPLHGIVQIGSNGGRTAIMLPQVQWSIFLPFLMGSLAGVFLGGVTVLQLPAGLLKAGLACFILWTVWAPPIGLFGRFAAVGTGVFSSFLTMFFGATGPFISAMVKTLNLGRMEHVATHSACMTAQHTLKVAVFGLLGFAYQPYLGLVVAMIISGFLGTVLGKRMLMNLNDTIFHRVLALILTALALKLLVDGLALL